MIINKICILGGSGFVGHSLANRLARDGYQLRILTRRREKVKDNLILLPGLELIQADIHDTNQLIKHFSGCDAVINLVGILNESGRKGYGFNYVHVILTQKIIDACLKTGVKRLLHMSALNADAEHGTSHYLKSKGEAENIAHAASVHNIKVTSFRPSVIFGHGDNFFNRFAFLLKISPWFFPLACPRAKFAPVYVNNVTEAFVRSLNNPKCFGQHYNLCGPHIYTLQELVEYTARLLGIRKKIIPLSDILSRIQAAIFDFVPGKPFSTDNYLSTKVDSICAQNDLITLGIPVTAIEAVLPQYLSNKHYRARYDEFRSVSRRVI